MCGEGQEGQAPRVSVIINCYNGMPYLPAAIESVYAQTFVDWEIILWDNASTDESPSVVSRYDNRLRYFRAEVNTPLGAARNLAMEQARGEYICFLDCDDLWFPEKLERQVAAMDSGDYALGYSGIEEMDLEGHSLSTYRPASMAGPMLEKLLFQFDINVPTTILRASALRVTGLSFDPQIHASEEYCLFMQLAARSNFLSTPDILARYRVHSGSLTAKSISRWAFERRYTLDRICADHPGIRERHQAAFTEAYARANYYEACYLASQGERAKARAQMAQVKGVGFRYLLLYCMLLLPLSLWTWVHEKKTGRAVSA